MSVEGVAKFKAQINQLRTDVLDEQYMKDAGTIVWNSAIALAPKNSGKLQNNIFIDFEREGNVLRETIYTNVEYAQYVEFGTGQRGAASHEGVSPNVPPKPYRLTPWWIHESQLLGGRVDGERYHWFYIDTDEGRFYQVTGQPAQPFMYPALKDNEQAVIDTIVGGLNYAAERATK